MQKVEDAYTALKTESLNYKCDKKAGAPHSQIEAFEGMVSMVPVGYYRTETESGILDTDPSFQNVVEGLNQMGLQQSSRQGG